MKTGSTRVAVVIAAMYHLIIGLSFLLVAAVSEVAVVLAPNLSGIEISGDLASAFGAYALFACSMPFIGLAKSRVIAATFAAINFALCYAIAFYIGSLYSLLLFAAPTIVVMGVAMTEE